MGLPFQASGIDLQQALREVGRLSGVPIIAETDMRGTVSLRDPNATLGGTMDEITEQSEAVWWYDGVALRVEPRSGMTSLLVPLGDVPGEMALRQLDALDLEDPGYPLRLSEGGDFLRVVGPAGYGQAVTEVIGRLATRIADRQRAIRQASRKTEPGEPPPEILGLPVIIRGPGRN